MHLSFVEAAPANGRLLGETGEASHFGEGLLLLEELHELRLARSHRVAISAGYGSVLDLATEPDRFGHPVDGHQIGRQPIVDLVLLGHFVDGVESSGHYGSPCSESAIHWGLTNRYPLMILSASSR